MEIKILKNVSYAITGKSVLKAIQDNNTPDIDLLVRESVQNSLDAYIKDPSLASDYVRMEFNTTCFKSSDFASILPKIDETLISIYGDFECEALIIDDTKTTGLLGGNIKRNDKPNNFYNLVYDIMAGKTEQDAGGSWGIGKSIYYRCGIGFCVFYSKTKEDNRDIEKLVITLIEDESKEDRILKNEKDNRGIAFIGGSIDTSVENSLPAPIYDVNLIENILKIFNTKRFKEKDTGTKIIIPYFNKNKMIETVNNPDNTKKSFDRLLSLSLQRWYFPRINNEKYNGKYLNVAINGNQVQLNDTFKALQNLYNNEYVDSAIKIEKDLDFGTLYVKEFSKEDLGILSYPNYLDDLDVQFDMTELDKSSKNPQILYTRKQGMILNYVENFEKAILDIDEDSYVIGIFVLNDDEKYKNERLGDYIRNCEKANHKSWEDSKDGEENLVKLKPCGKIKRLIKRNLTDLYAKKAVSESVQGDSGIGSLLARLLLPKEGFGKKASIRKKSSTESGMSTGKATKKSIEFVRHYDGKLQFSFTAKLKYKELYRIDFNVLAGSKRINFKSWMEMGFSVPIVPEVIKITDITSSVNRKVSTSKVINISKGINMQFDDLKISIQTLVFNNEVIGFGIVNNDPESIITLKGELYLKPVDKKYSVDLDENYKLGVK